MMQTMSRGVQLLKYSVDAIQSSKSWTSGIRNVEQHINGPFTSEKGQKPNSTTIWLTRSFHRIITTFLESQTVNLSNLHKRLFSNYRFVVTMKFSLTLSLLLWLLSLHKGRHFRWWNFMLISSSTSIWNLNRPRTQRTQTSQESNLLNCVRSGFVNSETRKLLKYLVLRMSA